VINAAKLDLTRVSFLVVDSDQAGRRQAEAALRGFGSKSVRTVADAEVGLDIIKNGLCDIVVTDFHLSPVNGLEFTKKIRKLERPTIPVIMLAANPTEAMVFRGRDAGVHEFLAKPLDVEALWYRIFSIIMRERDFIETEDYFGPDRRRRPDRDYEGPFRRTTDNPDDDRKMSDDDVAELLSSLVG